MKGSPFAWISPHDGCLNIRGGPCNLPPPERPKPTFHRLHPFTDDCVDCGRTFMAIALDPFADCTKTNRPATR